MKTFILLSLAVLSLAACKKEAKVAPTVTKPVVVTTPTTPTSVAPVVQADTIPDKAIFKLQLIKDSVNYDETMFLFNHTSTLSFNNNEDAPYMPGFGAESLASISNDGQDLAINGLPYKSGMSVGLDVNTKASGAYVFALSYINHVPANIKIYLKDNMTKDSVDVRSSNYTFNIDKTDASSYGNARFKLIIKDGGTSQPIANADGPH